MSGSRYFSETTSSLAFERINFDTSEADPQSLHRVIETAEKENLPDAIVNVLREQLATMGSATELSWQEVATLEQNLRDNSMYYYGVQVDQKGIYFEDCGAGNLYDAAEMLVALFDTVKETVLFSGSVEIWGSMIEEYERLEFKDSELIKVQGAKISWV